MPSDSVVLSLLEQVEGSHFSFIRFVGRVNRHEWDWSPDVGIPSARDLVGDLVREESRLAAKHGAGSGLALPAFDPKDLGSPSAASSALRSLREATLAQLRRQASSADEGAARSVVQSAVTLAQLDAHALGGLALLQRLIDPSRTGVSPR
jgi:hypothetical protein